MRSPTSAHGKAPRVAIVGGGFSGIAVAASLKREGIETFDVFENSDGPGGTWRDARYPGAAVDTPQPMYSFSFTKAHSFSRVFAEQPELLEYLENTVDDFGLRPHFHFNVQVIGAEWSEERAAWNVSLSTGEEHMYEVLVSAVGYLNNPRYPDWPHLSEFSGRAFHSARWEPV
jgi:cation diffusion facilitator CzcD-associated flavoprotein CzcO